tara:strand:- start:3256 stop:3621 length:366 start_codon:yes stop_codon:yes gene_type:complete
MSKNPINFLGSIASGTGSLLSGSGANPGGLNALNMGGLFGKNTNTEALASFFEMPRPATSLPSTPTGSEVQPGQITGMPANQVPQSPINPVALGSMQQQMPNVFGQPQPTQSFNNIMPQNK